MKNVKRTAAVIFAAAMSLGSVSSAFAGTYVVKEGDWLSKIAPQYNTTWQNLAEMNNLSNPDLIYPNQVLQVPDIVSETPDTEDVSETPEVTETPTPVETPTTTETAEPEVNLTSLSVTTMDNKAITPDFAPDVKDYKLTVQSDIYGVLVKAEGNGEIKVTADTDTYDYGAAEPSYTAGTEITYDETYGGYIVPLDQSYEGYDSEFVQTVTISVGDNTEYTIEITRENDSDVYALFEQKEFTDTAGTTIEYNIYVPSNYDDTKTYPVVLALHGSGQMTQPVDMILKRYQMATIWAKDSEAGKNECIVIAPQAKEQWSVVETIDDTTYPTGVPSAENIAAYELLQSVKDTYNVDENRIYLTGLSMGGMGSITMVYNHPDEFAALLPDAARDFVGEIDYSVFAPLSGKILYAHAEDDPTCDYASGKAFLDHLTEAGIEYETAIYPSGTFFYPSAHFSWTPLYADQSVRDWLFSQSK